MDTERMEAAINKLYNTDDAMRTVLVESDGKIMQKIVANYHYDLVLKETVGVTVEARLQDALEKADAVIDEPLTQMNQLMSKIDFYKIDENGYVMVIYISHMVADGVAVSMIINKIFRYYRDINAENRAIPYSEYRRYEETILESEEGRKHITYWEDK